MALANVDFEKLKNECLELKETHKQKEKLYQQLKAEQVVLKKKCKELIHNLQEYATAPQQESQEFIEQHYKTDKRQDIDSDKFTEKLEKHSYILGFRVTNVELIDTETQLVTLHYNEDFFVQFRTGAKFDLQQIYPKHPNFDAIKVMLSESNDIGGFLTIIREYFNFSIKTQLKETKAL